MTTIAATDRLDDDQLASVTTLLADVLDADDVRPLNDEAMLDLARDGAQHWLAVQYGRPVGYAQLSSTFGTAQLCVRPEIRRRGLGRKLLEAVAAAGAEGFWAFGDLPGARGLAAASGLVTTRSLLIMERKLDADTPAPMVPEGVTLAGYTDADRDGFLAVNAEAFAGHPEQGAFSASDLVARQGEAWWDPAGLIVARDEQGVVGFHWTKRHDTRTGEVYVIGVSPRAQGRGLGGVLLQAGFAHLARQGCTRVILYVEADNPAVRLYERTGFAVVHQDVLYGRPSS